MPDLTEQQLAQLIAFLPSPPESWVSAAQELPRARAGIDALVERAESDLAQRRLVLADLEAALRAEGIEPHPGVIREVRERLTRSD
jgi:hypothetical protein